jgi:N-acetylglutamate synthase-like GNAT family acetyltransferase
MTTGFSAEDENLLIRELVIKIKRYADEVAMKLLFVVFCMGLDWFMDIGFKTGSLLKRFVNDSIIRADQISEN